MVAMDLGIYSMRILLPEGACPQSIIKNEAGKGLDTIMLKFLRSKNPPLIRNDTGLNHFTTGRAGSYRSRTIGELRSNHQFYSVSLRSWLWWSSIWSRISCILGYPIQSEYRRVGRTLPGGSKTYPRLSLLSNLFQDGRLLDVGRLPGAEAYERDKLPVLWVKSNCKLVWGL